MDPIQVDKLKKLQYWFANIKTSGGKLRCKRDTGAEVNVLPSKVYDKLHPKPSLQSTNVKLTAYGGASIQPSGICQLACTSTDSVNSLNVEFYVTPVDAQTILGLTDCVALGLVKRVCPI